MSVEGRRFLGDALVIEPWFFKGKCSDPEDHFPEGRVADPSRRAAERRAKAACAVCPVLARCRRFALTFGPERLHGIWGGTTERERKKIKKRRPKKQAQ